MDNSGQPYCQEHARKHFPEYEKVVNAYDELRRLVAQLVQEKKMTIDDAKLCFGYWDGETG